MEHLLRFIRRLQSSITGAHWAVPIARGRGVIVIRFKVPWKMYPRAGQAPPPPRPRPHKDLLVPVRVAPRVAVTVDTLREVGLGGRGVAGPCELGRLFLVRGHEFRDEERLDVLQGQQARFQDLEGRVCEGGGGGA